MLSMGKKIRGHIIGHIISAKIDIKRYINNFY